MANIYLDRLDQELAAKGFEETRYADDFIIQCRTEAEALAAMEQVKQVVSELGLILHPQKTRIVEASQLRGFEFLGWHFERGYKWPREKSEKRFQETIRQQTRRTNGILHRGNHRSGRRFASRLNGRGWRFVRSDREA